MLIIMVTACDQPYVLSLQLPVLYNACVCVCVCVKNAISKLTVERGDVGFYNHGGRKRFKRLYCFS